MAQVGLFINEEGNARWTGRGLVRPMDAVRAVLGFDSSTLPCEPSIQDTCEPRGSPEKDECLADAGQANTPIGFLAATGSH